jgi:hypothetical protein
MPQSLARPGRPTLQRVPPALAHVHPRQDTRGSAKCRMAWPGPRSAMHSAARTPALSKMVWFLVTGLNERLIRAESPKDIKKEVYYYPIMRNSVINFISSLHRQAIGATFLSPARVSGFPWIFGVQKIYTWQSNLNSVIGELEFFYYLVLQVD